MPAFTKRFPRMTVGEYREIGTPWHAARTLPDSLSVRTFVTPSHTFPDEGYYLQAVKGKKAGWGNGSAVIMCNCIDAMLKFGSVLTGIKAPCKHAQGLKALLSRGYAYAKAED
jgi:hypothetical protein